jgi:small subunit ribosomal protein S5
MTEKKKQEEAVAKKTPAKEAAPVPAPKQVAPKAAVAAKKEPVQVAKESSGRSSYNRNNSRGNSRGNSRNNTRGRRPPPPPKVWVVKTSIGAKVHSKEITRIDDILNRGQRIFEPELVDALLPDGKTELLFIGQAKGKFGGGKRRAFRQTQKKTPEGNKPSFCCIAAFGNENGYVGIGYGKSKDTVPSREKAIRNAKIGIFKVPRGGGSWATDVPGNNSIPFAVEGKCGSVKIKLMPAPRGKGLCIEKECAKILKLAGIQDVWSKTQGSTKTKFNMIMACIDALKQLSQVKVSAERAKKLGMTNE